MEELLSYVRRIARPYAVKLERRESPYGDILSIELQSGDCHSRMEIKAYEFALMDKDPDAFLNDLIFRLRVELEKEIEKTGQTNRE